MEAMETKGGGKMEEKLRVGWLGGADTEGLEAMGKGGGERLEEGEAERLNEVEQVGVG